MSFKVDVVLVEDDDDEDEDEDEDAEVEFELDAPDDESTVEVFPLQADKNNDIKRIPATPLVDFFIKTTFFLP